jgi:hypothetical protein
MTVMWLLYILQNIVYIRYISKIYWDERFQNPIKVLPVLLVHQTIAKMACTFQIQCKSVVWVKHNMEQTFEHGTYK